MNTLLVFLGAGLGGIARHGVNIAALALMGPAGAPLATLSVNILGSLLMGFVIAWATLTTGLPPPLRLMLTTGLLGGFTTFSAFSLDVVLLLERGRIATALGYALSSAVLSAGALLVAMLLFRAALGLGDGR